MHVEFALVYLTRLSQCRYAVSISGQKPICAEVVGALVGNRFLIASVKRFRLTHANARAIPRSRLRARIVRTTLRIG